MYEVDAQKLKKDFLAAKPFPHIIIDNFLKRESLLELITGIQEENFHMKMSDLFCFYQTDDLVSSNHIFIKKFYEFFKSEQFINFAHELTGIEFTPNVVDLQGSIYQDTNFLLCHDDQLEGRKLAFLLYLSDMNEEEGGALTLFESKKGIPTKVTARIQPKINRFVCFEVSDDSFHEVEEVLADKQRLTLGGWLH